MPYFWHFFNKSKWMGGTGSGGGAGEQYIPYYVNGALHVQRNMLLCLK